MDKGVAGGIGKRRAGLLLAFPFLIGISLFIAAFGLWIALRGFPPVPHFAPYLAAAANLFLCGFLATVWRAMRRANRTERERAEILASFLESSSDSIFVKDTSLRMVLCNSAVAQAVGKRPEETYGRTDIENGWRAEQVKGDLVKGIKGWEADDLAVLGGATMRAEREPVDVGGRTRFYDTVKVPVRDATGAIKGVLGIGRDVTERTRAEAALRESEERYRSLFENMLNGFAYCRMMFENDVPVDFIYLETNDAFEKITGLREVKGKKVTEVIPGIRESNPELLEVYGRVSRTGNPQRLQTYVQQLTIWFSISVYSPRRDEFVAVFENITESKLLQERLERERALLRAVIHHLPDRVYVKDRDSRFVLVNPAFARFKGYDDPQNLVGKTDHDFFPRHIADRFRSDELRVMEHGVEILGAEEETRSVDGQQHWVLTNKVPLRDQAGGVTGLVGSSLDITERKSIQAQLLRVQRLESIGTLAGGIAHDLNNVLAPIIMGIEGLALQHADPRTREILDIIRSAAQRGAGIVRQVLSFAGAREGERGEIQLKHVLKEIEQIISETFPRSIAIATRVPKDLPPVIGDTTQLHQVLMNLCVNARDAMPGGGSLTLSAADVVLDEHYARLHIEARPIRYAVLQVDDTGTGIPPGIQDRIFDPFFTTKEPGKGTGLGLATTLTIVRSHGGFIEVSTNVPKGSSFKVYLPAAKQERTGAAEQVTEGLPMGEGETILVVDDEEAVRDITRHILDSYGYRGVTAKDGVEAVAIFAEKKGEIKAVITDMMMPLMDGTATIRALRTLDPEVKIIATSGMSGGERPKAAVDPPVDAFIAKPYPAETLLATLRTVLDRPAR